MFVISFVFACLIVSTGLFVTLLLDGKKRQEEIENRKSGLLNLALELKQSSDELTRFARTFASTRDPRFESYYRAVIAIRDGKRPHPRTYSRTFYDQLAAGSVDLDDGGETYGIIARMLELGISEQERKRIEEAKWESDDLVNLETAAFNAVHGRFKDAEGQFTVSDAPNLDMARSLLFDRTYHLAKQRIMKPIDAFFVLLETRTAGELGDIRIRNQAITWTITGLTAATIAFSVFVFVLLNRRILSPLKALEGGVSAVGQGNYDFRIALRNHDEIGTLSETFNAMAQGISQRTSDLATAYGTISESINYASAIQRSILPDTGSLDAVLADHFILWEPRDRVGGDIYWCDFWGDGLLMILADCTGHGVPGAFVTLLASGALEQAKTVTFKGDLQALVSSFHDHLQRMLGQDAGSGDTDDGLELGAIYIDPDMTRMYFVGARFDLFVVENGSATVVRGTRAGLGYRRVPRDQFYDVEEILLNGSRRFYLTSDGIIDQIGGERRRSFGKNRLKELLLEIQGLPMADQKAAIRRALAEFQGDEPRRDDVSAIGFAVREA